MTLTDFWKWSKYDLSAVDYHLIFKEFCWKNLNVFSIANLQSIFLSAVCRYICAITLKRSPMKNKKAQYLDSGLEIYTDNLFSTPSVSLYKFHRFTESRKIIENRTSTFETTLLKRIYKWLPTVDCRLFEQASRGRGGLGFPPIHRKSNRKRH